MSIVERFTSFDPQILALTRIMAGVMFAAHGAQKVLGAFGGIPPERVGFVSWTAGTIELVAGVLIALGLLTRVSAFLSSGLMAVAYFVGHASGGFWPTQNGGELAVLYCFFFLYLAARGPGAWAIDNMLRRRQGDRSTVSRESEAS